METSQINLKYNTMSTSPTPRQNSDQKKPKFTKGEKCLFVHLVITFSLIILLIIVYFIHLCLVDHTLLEALRVYRRGSLKKQDEIISDNGLESNEFEHVGIIYLNITPARLICNIMLVQKAWSLCPAHCIVARTDPDLSDLLRQWRVMYWDATYIDSAVVKTVPHPKFNRDDFSNNIGLIEHEYSFPRYEYIFPISFKIDDETFESNAKNIKLIAWDNNAALRNKDAIIRHFSILPVPLEKCTRFLLHVVELRSYEFCVIPDQINDVVKPDHGALMKMNSEIIGLFSWGEKTGRGAPYVILNIIQFKDWIDYITSW